MQNEKRVGVGFFGLLLLLFIGLKLVGIITWSWVWVLAPFWLPFAIWMAIILVAFFAVLAFHLYK